MKLKLRKKDHVFLVLALAATTVGLSVKLASSKEASVSCSTPGQERIIIMSDDTFSPTTITADQCDRVVLLNQDTQDYRPAMGVHSEHVEYPGFLVSTVPAGEGVSFIASQAGHYQLHDHLRDIAHANLTIAHKK